MASILEYLELLVSHDYFDYILGGALVVVWWLVSKTRHTLRRLSGEEPLSEDEDVALERPRRRLPLY